MIQFIWPLVTFTLLYLFLKNINNALMILLKIKKCNSPKTNQITLFFLEKLNKEVIFYESPLFSYGFGIHVLSQNKLGFVISKDDLQKLSNEDITEIIQNIFTIYFEKIFFFKIINKCWSFLFVLPFAVILLPSLFVTYRLFVIEKFFALPIFSLAQGINQVFISKFFIRKDLKLKLKFRQNSMISRIDEYLLGPHLLFNINSSFYKILRDKTLAS